MHRNQHVFNCQLQGGLAPFARMGHMGLPVYLGLGGHSGGARVTLAKYLITMVFSPCVEGQSVQAGRCGGLLEGFCFEGC